jgi:hypothetical protein
LYDQAGVDLDEVPLVGLGSVCRRQATSEIEHLIRRLQPLPAARLRNQDVWAWPGTGTCWSRPTAWPGLRPAAVNPRAAPPSHRNEANCRRYALSWYDQVLARAADGQYDQLELEVAA